METLTNLKRVYGYGKKYKKHFIKFVLGSIFAIIINVIYPLFAAKQLLYITSGLIGELVGASFIVLSVLILRQLNSSFIKINTQYYFRGITKDIQTKLAKEILKISTKDLDETSSGVFIQRLTSDTTNLSHVFTKGIGYITGILSQIGIFIAVFILNYIVGIYYLCTSLVVTFIYVYYSRIREKKDKEYRSQYEKVSGLTSELVRGARDIKMLNSKDIYVDNLTNNIEEASNKMFALRDIDRYKSIVVWSSVAFFEFILVLLIILLYKHSLIAISVALIVFNYHDHIYENLMERIDNLITELKDFTVSANRVFAILDNKEFTKENFGKHHLERINGNIEFKKVKFSYNKSTKVFEDLNLKISANKTYAIVGKSGEGKTTIFNLLCKMYECESGEITIDGININELDEDSIRGNITIISQNPYIFNLSIKDNLKLVKKDVTDDEIKEACKMACLDEFIEGLPDKYDTVVGEGGVMLSGGQRQRLAIARAFIQQTKIILFDEATSALDNETQSKIQEAINNMKKDYTILIIAHRFSTILNSDKIFYIGDGKVINSGTHATLLKKCKQYKMLYEAEFKETE